jgi:malate/lactate dehydrogenase
MTTKPLTLIGAVELLKTLPTEEAIEREDLQLFVERIEKAGKSIIQARGAEYLEEVSVLLLSSVLAELLNNPDSTNLQLFMMLQSRPDIFQLVLGYAFVYSLGIGVVEELY